MIERLAPIGLAVSGMLMFSAMDAVVKSLAGALPPPEVVFFRFAGSVVWLALYLVLFRQPWPQRRYLPRHAMRAVLLALTAFLFFHALAQLPLALTTALAMAAPIYVAILSALFLKEPTGPGTIAAVGLGIAGSLVIVFGGAQGAVGAGGASLDAWLAAILAPLCYAGAMVMLKAQSTDEPAPAITLAQSAMVALIALPVAATDFVMPQGTQWVQVALTGLLGSGGFLLFIAALRRLPATVFGLVDYTTLLWAALFGYVLFAEVPDASLWLGGALIISACALGLFTTPRPAAA